MRMRIRKPKPGEMVILTGLPAGFLDDLPTEDQLAISKVVGKRVRLEGYDADGRAELMFRDAEGILHTIWVRQSFVKSPQKPGRAKSG